jgi:NOL1/NOP2/fmu family ribosome biogenesis protein
MFRKEEAAVTDWSVETVQMCADRQRQILHSAAQMLRAGGRLVYSTCTFAPEENEETVAAFLESHPDFYPEEVSAPWFVKSDNGSFRLLPHKLKGEGHFAAVLRRKGDGEVPSVTHKAEKLPAEWVDFAKALGITLPDGYPMTFGTSLYWVPKDLPDVSRLKVMRTGLELGVVKKGRFEPAHALALWLKGCKNTVSFSADSDGIRQYLHGDVVPSDQRGWCLVQVDGYSIGWGKGDGTVLKNHYPKGLRR